MTAERNLDQSADKEPQKVLPSADLTPWLALTAGALYIGAVLFREWILGAFGVPVELSPEYLKASGTDQQAATVALRIPALLLIAVAWVKYPVSRLRSSLTGEPARSILKAILWAVALSFVLNLLGIWPFKWRWASDSTSAYLGILVSSAQWLAVLLWVLTAVAVGPLIEEVVFRFGLLQVIRDHTHSTTLAIVASSALFSFGHLGYLPPDFPHVLNAFWLFGFSLFLGAITLRHQGRIGVSLAAHAARNALEIAVFFLLAPHR